MGDDKKKRAVAILKRLKKEYPEPVVELDYSTPFELLVAVMLSALRRTRREALVLVANVTRSGSMKV